MASIPDFPVRDLKMEAITKLAHEDWDLPTPENTNLETVSLSFRANIARVRFLMLLPTSIAGQMARTQAKAAAPNVTTIQNRSRSL
jgi:hypothetical protein